MGSPLVRGPRWWMLPAALLAAIAWTGLCGPPVYAGPLDKLDTSLGWVPADAATYSSMLRNREQIEAIGKSKAWAAIKALPAAQRLRDEIKKALDGPDGGKVRAILENPEVQKGLALLGDMFSNEVFFFADSAAIDLGELFQKLNSSRMYGTLTALASGGIGPGETPLAQAQLMLATLAENIELLKVPNAIIGFRVKDQKAAADQITKLEMGINGLAFLVPELTKIVKRQKAGDGDYLTFTVNGSMIPWDQIPLDMGRQIETNRGDLDKVVAKIKKSTLMLALGLRKDYLLVAIGPSTDCLAGLGKGPRLADVAEMKKLEQFADQRVVAINYVSKAAAERMALSAADVDGMVRMVQGIVKESKLPSTQKEKIAKDIQELGSDLKPSIPKAGAMVGVSFLTVRGMESYAYTWGDHSSRSAAKPLSILSHVGGQPILALAGRDTRDVKDELKDYDLLVKWVKKLHGYFEDIALPQLGPGEREVYNKVMESLRPLAGRLDAATRNKLIPALADGQIALVLDGKLMSRQFCRHMPTMDKPMPMVEAALVFGVTNADLLREAMAEYREIWNGGVEMVQKLNPREKEIGKFTIPKPQSATSAAGTVYFYQPPSDWGIDKQIALSLGLSDKIAVITDLEPAFGAVAEGHAALDRRSARGREPPPGCGRRLRLGRTGRRRRAVGRAGSRHAGQVGARGGQGPRLRAGQADRHGPGPHGPERPQGDADHHHGKLRRGRIAGPPFVGRDPRSAVTGAERLFVGATVVLSPRGVAVQLPPQQRPKPHR